MSYGNRIVLRNFRRILLLGDSGSGKSETINNLFKKHICEVGHDINSQTDKCTEYHLKFKTGSKDCLFYIIDSPGRDDTDPKKKVENLLHIRDFIDKRPIDFTFVCYNFAVRRCNISDFVDEVDKYLNDDKIRVSWKNLVVMVTHSASLRKYSWEITNKFNGPRKYKKRKEYLIRRIREVFNERIGVEPPIVFIENDSDLLIEKDGFELLPDGKSWFTDFWDRVVTEKNMDQITRKMFSSAFLYEHSDKELTGELEEFELEVLDSDAVKNGELTNEFIEREAMKYTTESTLVDKEELMDDEDERFFIKEKVLIKSPEPIQIEEDTETLSSVEEYETDPNPKLKGEEEPSQEADEIDVISLSFDHPVKKLEWTVELSNSVPIISEETIQAVQDEGLNQEEREILDEDEESSEQVNIEEPGNLGRSVGINRPRTVQQIAHVQNVNNDANNNVRNIAIAVGAAGAGSVAIGGYVIAAAGGIALAPVLAPVAVAVGIAAMIGGVIAFFKS